MPPYKRLCSSETLSADASGVVQAASGGANKRKAPSHKAQIQDLRGEIEILTHQLESVEQLLKSSQRERISFRSLVAQQKQLRERAQTENAQASEEATGTDGSREETGRYIQLAQVLVPDIS